MVLSTLGYEGVKLSEFIETLKQNDVNVLVDVRENPVSRKKGFSKTALKEALLTNGIQYVHFPDLGSRREVRKAYRLNKDWDWFSQEYVEYLDSGPQEIEQLTELIFQDHCCLMCFEADHTLCHRSLLSDYLCKNIIKTELEINNLTVEEKGAPA